MREKFSGACTIGLTKRAPRSTNGSSLLISRTVYPYSDTFLMSVSSIYYFIYEGNYPERKYFSEGKGICVINVFLPSITNLSIIYFHCVDRKPLLNTIHE